MDIPPKYLSFVFYIPEARVSAAEEEHNATILYDRQLTPHYRARYRANSLCVFAPHFYSYHGFSSTIERDVLVMFYISEEERGQWSSLAHQDDPPYRGFKDAITAKLSAHPLIEYGRDGRRILEERGRCLVNAPRGRVMRVP